MSWQYGRVQVNMSSAREIKEQADKLVEALKKGDVAAAEHCVRDAYNNMTPREFKRLLTQCEQQGTGFVKHDGDKAKAGSSKPLELHLADSDHDGYYEASLVLKPGDGPFQYAKRDICDTATDSLAGNRQASLALQRQELTNHIKENSPDKNKPADKYSARLEKYMGLFEKRARKEDLTPKEISAAYTEVSRLFGNNKEAPVSKQARLELAEQVLRNLAEPTTIDQGQHNTCNVTTIEIRLYTKEPAVATRVVADVALNGKLETADGLAVELDGRNFSKDPEAQVNTRTDSKRSYAGQLFQLAAINSFWADHALDEEGNKVEAGNVRYIQDRSLRTADNTNGEALVKFKDGVTTILKDEKGKVIDRPLLSMGDMAEVYYRLTGAKADNIFIAQMDKVDPAAREKQVKTEADLTKALLELQQQKELPAIVIMDSAKIKQAQENKFPDLNRITYELSDRIFGYPSGGPLIDRGLQEHKAERPRATAVPIETHVGCVMNVEAINRGGTNYIQHLGLDNQWGRPADWLGLPANKELGLAATRPRLTLKKLYWLMK